MCFPQHEVQETRSVGKEESDAMGFNPGEVYGDEGGLEGDEIRAAQKENKEAFARVPLIGPFSPIGTFAFQRLPRIVAGALKRTATDAPYDGLRIKTPGKV